MSTRRLEKLKIVFRLECDQGAEMQIGENTLTQLVKSGGIDDAHALHVIIGTMERLGITLEFKRNDGTLILASEFSKQVESQGKWGTSLEAGGLEFRFGNITALKQSYILIEEKEVGAAQSWDEWVSPFFSEPSFVQAWISDIDYDYWQNASDPVEYTTAGRDYHHLPMKSNGLPFPLEQQVVDTSKNPGHWVLKKNYIEAIGWTMWLSDEFLRVTGASKNNILKQDWIDCRETSNGLLRIQIGNKPFSSDEGSEAVVQQRLRQLLFPNKDASI